MSVSHRKLIVKTFHLAFNFACRNSTTKAGTTPSAGLFLTIPNCPDIQTLGVGIYRAVYRATCTATVARTPCEKQSSFSVCSGGSFSVSGLVCAAVP